MTYHRRGGPADIFPYFPFLTEGSNGSVVARNPVEDKAFHLNPSAADLLRRCNGNRSLQRIASVIAAEHRMDYGLVLARCQEVLEFCRRQGVVWFRERRAIAPSVGPPVFVLWNMTNACNHRCLHCCVASSRRTRNELGLGQCQRLIDQLSAFGVRYLVLSGGEPLMHPHFVELATYAHRKGFGFQVATNATLVSSDLARRLADLGASAQVSLDGSSPRVHDDFRQCRGAWHRTVRGIRLLVDARIPVMIAATVTRKNAGDLPDLYELAKRLGVRTFRILPFVPFGRGRTARALEVSPGRMKQITQWLFEKRGSHDIAIAPLEFECTLSQAPPGTFANPHTHIGCDGAVAYCTVTAEGNVLPCNFFHGVRTHSVAERDFAWIWQNCEFLKYFRSLTVSDIRGVCQECEWLGVCKGSCVAASFVHGDLFQSNRHCWHARELSARHGGKSCATGESSCG